MLYVPSMRNGAKAFEDRGNAIVSTEPLHTPFAVELPLERQRRVAVGAGIDVRTPNGLDRLDVLSAHLEPLSSPASLWIFKSPRPRQVLALLHVLRTSRPSEGWRSSGSVLGGDFNTIQAGADEEAYPSLGLVAKSAERGPSANTSHGPARFPVLPPEGWLDR